VLNGIKEVKKTKQSKISHY